MELLSIRLTGEIGNLSYPCEVMSILGKYFEIHAEDNVARDSFLGILLV